MAIYSKPAKLAVRILTYIADQEEGRLCTVHDAALGAGVSEPTVAKILQLLARDGLLESRKGPGGGFRLVSPPREITLWQIVTAVEGGEPLSDCVGGLEGCSEANPCALHSRWKGVKAQLVRFLEETTLHDIRVAARHVGQLVDS